MASDILANAGNEMRENLVTAAIKFLQNPNVQRHTLESKEKFLRSKGLTDPEIHSAIEKCAEMIDVPSMTSELLFFQARRNWFKEHVVPILVYAGFAYGAYWFYKNCVRQLLFVEEPKRKTTAECIDELRKSLDILNTNVTSLRSEMVASAQQSALRSQLDNIKSDIASVKGLLLNRNQFPALKTRTDPPCIPSWQRQSEEATSTEPPPEEKKKPHRTRSQRSESGGSNSSEGEQATKNSDSSLEIMQRSGSGGSNSSEGEQATKNSDSSLEIMGGCERSEHGSSGHPDNSWLGSKGMAEARWACKTSPPRPPYPSNMKARIETSLHKGNSKYKLTEKSQDKTLKEYPRIYSSKITDSQTLNANSLYFS